MALDACPDPVTPRTGGPRTAGLRALLAVLLAATLSAALLGVAPPARADAVGSAQARVDALQGEVSRVAVQLVDGTRRYAADRARLTRVDQLMVNTRSKIGRAQAQADRGARTVGQIAAQLYRAPQPGLLLLSLSESTADITEILAVQNDLQQVSGRQAGEVRRAVAARVTLQGEQRVLQELRAEAAALARRSTQERSALIALAEATSVRLDAAQRGLAVARAARAAQIAAQARAAQQARAARAAQRPAAQRPAAASRAAAPAVAPQHNASTASTACAGGSTAGRANGNLDPAALCPLWSAAGERLRADAARAFNAMSRSKARTTGTALCVTDSYRSYREQVSIYATRPGLAAIPGTSNHGWGQAVDLCGGAQSFGGAAYRWLKANAGRFGFSHPAWAEPGRGMEEPWHWEYGG